MVETLNITNALLVHRVLQTCSVGVPKPDNASVVDNLKEGEARNFTETSSSSSAPGMLCRVEIISNGRGKEIRTHGRIEGGSIYRIEGWTHEKNVPNTAHKSFDAYSIAIAYLCLQSISLT